MGVILAAGLVLLSCLMPIASHESQYYVRATVDSKTYKFNWDFKIREDDDGTHLIKNSHANQSTIKTQSGKLIGLEIFPCCTHGFIHPYPFLSKGDTKVSVYGLKTGKHYNLKFIDGCRQDSCKQNWTLPGVNKGMYKLVVRISNDEMKELYLTKLRIS
jgi:hypothetical protein